MMAEAKYHKILQTKIDKKENFPIPRQLSLRSGNVPFIKQGHYIPFHVFSPPTCQSLY